MDLQPTSGEESGCQPERSEGYAVLVRRELMQILRFPQNDRLSREFPWARGAPEAMKISVVPAKAGTQCRSNGFPPSRERRDFQESVSPLRGSIAKRGISL